MSSKDPVEVPYLPKVHDIINKHMKLIDSNLPPKGPSINDELEILINLMGISRLIEYNMRVGYERFNNKEDLGLPNPYSFQELIQNIKPYITEKNKMDLLDKARLISNGLVHSNFEKVYINTKEAYEIEGLKFDQKKFDPPVVLFKTTITKTGLNVLVKGDEATAQDGHGNPIPTKTLKPDGTNEIHIDFKYYYLTGAFGFTWDVLKLAYSDSVVFKRDMTE